MNTFTRNTNKMYVVSVSKGIKKLNREGQVVPVEVKKNKKKGRLEALLFLINNHEKFI